MCHMLHGVAAASSRVPTASAATYQCTSTLIMMTSSTLPCRVHAWYFSTISHQQATLRVISPLPLCLIFTCVFRNVAPSPPPPPRHTGMV